MDTEVLNHPVISDRLALEEFAEALSDRAPEIERDIARLKTSPHDRELVADLFRAVHNIKGDAALCKFPLGVAIAHPIEGLIARLREGKIVFSELTAEAILVAVDRLELATDSLLRGKSIEHLLLPTLVEQLELTAVEHGDELDAACANLIEAVTGFPPVVSKQPHKARRSGRLSSDTTDNIAHDLNFFRSLALQLESRSPLFKGRTMRVLRLALETNKERGTVVAPQQLEAAVYLHDIGMMMLPESNWLKVGKLDDADKLALKNHPGYAAGLLQRMPGWDLAAQIIAQHHETPDGTGYPLALKDADICEGARLLAIVDAFEAVMLKHIHRGKNRSVLRAVAEINACNNQFSMEWIGPFNSVIRRTLES